MAVSPILLIPQVAPTQTDKTTTINDAIVQLEAALQDQTDISFAAGDVTLTVAQYTRFQVFRCTAVTAARRLITPLTKRVYWVRNIGANAVTVGGVTGATVAVAAGSGAVISCDGVDNISYGSGGPGPTGAPGAAGGGVSINYGFNTATANADPGAGKIALNNATQNTATAIYASFTDIPGTSWQSVLATISNGTSPEKGTLRLYKISDPTHWLVLSVTGYTAHTGYGELTATVTGSSSANPFTSLDPIGFTFTRTGNIGAAGATGAAGTPGAPGTFTAADFAAMNLSTLPTADPGSGKPWLNGGVLQVGP